MLLGYDRRSLSVYTDRRNHGMMTSPYVTHNATSTKCLSLWYRRRYIMDMMFSVGLYSHNVKSAAAAGFKWWATSSDWQLKELTITRYLVKSEAYQVCD